LSFEILPRTPSAVQLQVLFPPFKVVYPDNVVQHAVITDNMGRRYIRSVVDLKQDFFLVVDRLRREYLFGGQVTKVCPYRQVSGAALAGSNFLWSK